MIKVHLRYDGNGRFYTCSRHDFDTVISQLKQGDVLTAELRRPRSVNQNQAFHALMEQAFDNQSAGPHFESWRHLKAWVLIQCGHCETWRFAAGSMSPEVANVLRQKFDFVDISKNSKTGEIVLRFAKSIGFNELDNDQMTALFDKAINVIAEHILPGVDVDAMRKECTSLKGVADTSKMALTGRAA